jgi:hypothetical protein
VYEEWEWVSKEEIAPGVRCTRWKVGLPSEVLRGEDRLRDSNDASATVLNFLVGAGA